MNVSVILTSAAIVGLTTGAVLVIKADSRKIARLAVERAPSRRPLLIPIPAVLPSIGLGIVGIACAFAVAALYRPGGVVAQRDLAAFETVAEASRRAVGSSLSNADYFQSLAKVTAVYKNKTLLETSFDRENLASSDTTPRNACAKMLELVGHRLVSAPSAKLSTTEDALVQYCLPHLK